MNKISSSFKKFFFCSFPYRPDTKPPNTKTISLKHSDTESEIEKMNVSSVKCNNKKDVHAKEEPDGKDGETTSSDDGWVYTPADGENKSEENKKSKAAVRLNFGEVNVARENGSPKGIKHFSAKNIPRLHSSKVSNNIEPISSINRELVDRADELVRTKPKSYRVRNLKLKLSKEEEKERPPDSCDASGEYTEDSDDWDSQSSEENDGSIATCRGTGSAEGILDETLVSKPESLSRSFGGGRNRPWSMSNVSLLRSSRGSNLRTRAYMSESALNQMLGQFEKSRDCGFWGTWGSSRKRRTKLRKRTVRINFFFSSDFLFSF